MNIKLALTILATLVEEVAVVLIVLLVLPRFGIHIPLPGFIAIIVGLGVGGVISYRVIGRALMKKPVVGLSTMVDSKGKVVSRLHPEGVVRVSGELWQAISAGEEIGPGEEVIVVGQNRLKLIVRKVSLKESE